jgi:hypothetical protein
VASPEEIAFLSGHPTGSLLDMLEDLEVYVLYAFEKKWFEHMPDKEQRVSLIKSELGRRGVFD